MNDMVAYGSDALDDAFRRLAPGWSDPLAARLEDVEEIAVAIADAVFHRDHGPECGWSDLDRLAYEGWIDAVHRRRHPELAVAA